jgi:hypothetical protein
MGGAWLTRLPEMELRMMAGVPRVRTRSVVCVALLLTAMVTGVACVHDDSVYPVAAAGQGGVSVHREAVPPPPPRAAAPMPATTGPTAREIELQQKIDAMERRSRELESQSKSLQIELERLKKEAANK